MIRNYSMTIEAGQSKTLAVVGNYVHATNVQSDGGIIECNAESIQDGGALANLILRSNSEFKTPETFDNLRFVNNGATQAVIAVIAGTGEYDANVAPEVQTVAFDDPNLNVTNDVKVINATDTALAVEPVITPTTVVGYPAKEFGLIADNHTIAANPNRKTLLLRTHPDNLTHIWIASDGSAPWEGIPLWPGESMELHTTSQVIASTDQPITSGRRTLYIIEVVV